MGRGVPTTGYFGNLMTLYDGRHRDALKGFEIELRGAIKTSDSRWIDSICYHTMTGECYYQMGRPGDALDHYDAALNLYVAYYDWMIRVVFPPTIQSSSAAPTFAWGRSSRGAMLGRFPTSLPIAQGRINNNNIIKEGGVVQSPVLIQVNVVEIVRATCLAIRRRHEIMGPTCKLDRLTLDVLERLSRRPGPGNHWSSGWIDAQLGLAYLAAGSTVQAETTLKRSLVVGGHFDHPLTATGLLALARMAFDRGDFPAAASYCEEATYAAAAFLDLGVLEEAFRLGQATHLAQNQKDLYPPLAAAAGWARQSGYRQLQASLILLAAENMATIGNTGAASQLFAESRPVIGRRDMGRGAIGNRLNYVAALVAYQSGNATVGDAALAAALDYQRGASLRNFQIALAEKMLRSDDSGRQSMLLYDVLLREPTTLEWDVDPVGCLAASMMPNFAAMEHWYDAALRRRDLGRASDISDLIRRRRFCSTLPLGGRLMNLRWLLDGPTDALSKEAVLNKQDLLTRFPHYAELSKERDETQARLAAAAVVPDSAAARRAQTDLFVALAKSADGQRSMLRELSVRRIPVSSVFPPERTLKEIQPSLPPGHVVLAFFSTSNSLHASMFSRDKSAQWRIASPERLRRHVITLLRDMGNWDSNHQLPPADLVKEPWRASGQQVLDALLEKSNVDLRAKFEELTIVPDGFLWYLPFEALPIGSESLISRVRIRYAPTLSLATSSTTVAPPQTMGVVVGRLSPQDTPEVARTAFERISKSVPGAVALSGPPSAPSTLYRTLFDSLIVLDDVEPANSPYEWSPAQLDRGKTAGALSAWLAMPEARPGIIVLPGFHSAAESSMKKNGNGNDLFLSVCGLLASGARTVLISRWRTGGQTSYDLVREFAQEVPHMSPAAAWQRSVQVVSENPLDLGAEPRIKRTGGDLESPPARHPFFWAGYMLVDPGVPLKPVANDLPPAEKPAGPPVPAVAREKRPAAVADAGEEAAAAETPGKKSTE